MVSHRHEQGVCRGFPTACSRRAVARSVPARRPPRDRMQACAARHMREHRRDEARWRRPPRAPQLNEKTAVFMLLRTAIRVGVTFRASSSCNAAHK
ncbi:hypothetical protein LA76x_1947 [Lysobacter antibioticus]|uniref:Uncharacterized protein n=1 Tax=Lysobacter antibioticus TaxID=84531 RepID=A0A0S2F9A5_LYSAN|nr:hypothetical protein LA76x_1947 [Lysobacter antibioticus]